MIHATIVGVVVYLASAAALRLTGIGGVEILGYTLGSALPIGLALVSFGYSLGDD